MDPDLFRSVSVLGCGKSMVRGRVQYDSLLLRSDHINTLVLVEVLDGFTKLEALLTLNYVWHSFSRDG